MNLPNDPPDWFIPALNKALTRLEYGQDKADAAPDLWNLIRDYLSATERGDSFTAPSV